MGTAFLVVAVAFAGPSFAAADVMTPEHQESLQAPTDCPLGAEGVAGQHGDIGHSPYCRPTVCQNDSGCPGNTGPCRPQALCIRQQQSYGQTGPDGQPLMYGIATGLCGPEDRCDPGVCQTELRCVGGAGPAAGTTSASAGPGSAPATSRGCACTAPGGAVGGRSVALALAGLALGLGLVLRARRC